MARDGVVQTMIRLRGDLHAKVAASAKRRGVSMNWEMCYRLDRSFHREELIQELEAMHMKRETA